MKTGYKEYSDAYLMTFTKKRLIEQLRCAEDNFRRTEWMLNQQAENIKDWGPVIHAHWYTYPDDKQFKCSNCKTGVDLPTLYCPNCGARMDEEVEQ